MQGHKTEILLEANFLGGQSEHSPGNRSAGVSTGEHAVLLLRVDHGWVNCQRGTGVHNRAGSVSK